MPAEQSPHATSTHTRVPNVVSDWVEPLLPPAERDCLRYIIRRTYGFNRKERDTISLEQFESGISSGNYLLDLGTGLSRGTIKKALEGLEEKGLMIVRYSCTRCYWEQQPGEPEPPAKDGQAPTCPRCRRTLSRSWGLAAISPKKVCELLNKFDKKKRIWHWDKAAQMPYWSETAEEAKTREQTEQDLREEAIRIRDHLWHKKLVDQCAATAEQQLKAGRKLSIQRRISSFYKPIYELQETYSNPALVKYAIEEALAHGVLSTPSPWTWHRYVAAICKRKQQNFQGGGPAQGTNAAAQHTTNIRTRELAMRELLARASELNDSDKADAARALLSDILAQVKDLCELFGDDERLCENSLREAFKQGSTDFVGIRPQEFGGLDFYPEWSWPTDEIPAVA